MEKFYTLPQIAKERMLGYSTVVSLRRLCKAGKIEYVNRSDNPKRDSIVISEKAINEYLKKHRKDL